MRCTRQGPSSGDDSVIVSDSQSPGRISGPHGAGRGHSVTPGNLRHSGSVKALRTTWLQPITTSSSVAIGETWKLPSWSEVPAVPVWRWTPPAPFASRSPVRCDPRWR